MSLLLTVFDVIATVNALEERLEDIITPDDVSIIGCVVNGPGEALVSGPCPAGAANMSAFAEGASGSIGSTTRISFRCWSDARARAAMMDPANRILVDKD